MPELLAQPLLLADALSGAKGIVGVLLGVGALIFFHELGHFLAAKWAGVKVEVFSIGFGHRLFGFQRGGTDYRISMLPLGGYVKMLGQADDDPVQAPTDREDDFRNKSVGKRFVILVAGVVMNLLLAAVGFILAFGLGMRFDAAQIGEIGAGSAAARADLKPGDIILEIDGDEVLGWQDLRGLVALGDGELELKVLRDGKTFTTTARPTRGPDDTFARLGVLQDQVIAGVEPGSPLAKAGVVGATPTQCDSVLNVSPVSSRCDPGLRMKFSDWAQVVEEHQGPLTFTFQRTRYDPETFLPIGSETFQADVEFPRKPVYTLGLQIPDHAYVRRIVEDSAADKAGMKLGDRVVSMGAQKAVTVENLNESVKLAGLTYAGKPVPIVVERTKPDGSTERLELKATLDCVNQTVVDAALKGVTDEAEQLEIKKSVGNWLLGIGYRADIASGTSKLPLTDEDEKPVEIQPGDQLVKVWTNGGLWWNGGVPYSQGAIQAELNRRRDDPVKIEWQPKGSDELRSAVVAAYPHPTETYASTGFSVGARPVVIERGPIGAVGIGLQQTWIQTGRIFLTLRSFFTGGVSPKELGGPIQIVTLVHTVATDDNLARLLHLLAILSVNLAVINILPIPVLDGGHIFFLMIEKLKGRPVSGQVMIWAQWFGLACILALMALVFFNDITRQIQ